MFESPRALVGRLYQLISGPAQHDRNWDAVRELFLPDARLYSELHLPDGEPQSGTWTVEQFCEAASAEYQVDGFWEREIANTIEEFGNVAHVWSTYETRVGSAESPPIVRGINSIQLLRREGRWWITSIAFHVERGSEGIPHRYLPDAGPDSLGT